MATSNGDAPAAVQEAKSDADATAEDLARAPETLNMSDTEELNAANSKDNSEGGKIKALLNVLRRMIGVKDLAAIRLSLPANLLEPIPNLEYWNYMDRADLFTVVGELEDPTDRMLAVLRFMFCKELKFVHGKICKPYNSILGEHFRCHWLVQPPEVSAASGIIPKMAIRNGEEATPLPLAGSVAPVRPATSKLRRSANATSASKEASTDASLHRKEASAPAQGSAAATPATPTGTTKSTISGAGTSPLAPMSSADSGKTRRGLSRFLSAARTNKSSSNSTVSSESASTTTARSPALSAQTPDQEVDESVSADAGNGQANKADGDEADNDDEPVSPTASFNTSKSTLDGRRVCFLTEQVSHHPPISSFFVECKESGVQLRGVDQLSAKFTGTNIKIYPGERNQGIFLGLTDKARCGAEGEEYKITHPTASINGLLRGSLWVSIQNTTHVVCRGGERASDNGKRLCALTEYKDESWVMKAKYALEGVVYEFDESTEDPEEYKTIRDVPQDRIVFTYEGTWKGQVTWKLKGEKESRLLIDLNQLEPVQSINVRPLESQEDMESRKIWNDVTTSILNKEFGTATKHKQTIEQLQRDTAAERKRKGESFVPRFFDENIDDGRPKLTEAGRAALDGELELHGYDSAKDGQ